ncbi:hypothetical protein [Microtetraspora malaysiensis]|uniref:hypothetical protein n=1 Tax=Microtetraspora malaysiensis TaxID=161358 RepID=UPI003D91A8D8
MAARAAGRATGPGPARRPAPIVPLALLDAPDAADRLADALAWRVTAADPRTVSRELSILRGAITWWRARGWVRGDPLARLRPPATPRAAPRGLSPTRPPRSSISPPACASRRTGAWSTRPRPPSSACSPSTSTTSTSSGGGYARTPASAGGERGPAAPLLLVGRSEGPVFLARRRASAGTPVRDRCSVTGRGRLSYRRAAELFTTATRPLDPDGHGWTLRRLRSAGVAHRSGEDLSPSGRAAPA